MLIQENEKTEETIESGEQAKDENDGFFDYQEQRNDEEVDFADDSQEYINQEYLDQEQMQQHRDSIKPAYYEAYPETIQEDLEGEEYSQSDFHASMKLGQRVKKISAATEGYSDQPIYEKNEVLTERQEHSVASSHQD